ncbi:MAG: ABC transporter ATP-binding protein [Gammaproteobacteria bacterium]
MIETSELCKNYGRLTAVDNISFSVAPGEVLGFLGPNGAGKSTAMRMLAGFVKPSSGTANICGFSIDDQPKEVKQSIGYLPEGAPSYGEMTPLDFLDFIADVRGLDSAQHKKGLDDAVDRLQLGDVLHQSIETLSKGFKRRVGLAQAILHNPPVLILDEPTDGLDPNQKHHVRELINDMARDKIIVISTHILEEVDAVCNRAVVISRGRIVVDETPEELIARSRYHNAITLKTKPGADVASIRNRIVAEDGVKAAELDEKTRQLTAFPEKGAMILNRIGTLAAEQNWEIESLQQESGRLDEVFRTVTNMEAS